MTIAYNLAEALAAKKLAENIGGGVVKTSDDSLFALRQKQTVFEMDWTPPGMISSFPLFKNATADEIAEYLRTRK